jgi:hypothetical protein
MIRLSVNVKPALGPGGHERWIFLTSAACQGARPKGMLVNSWKFGSGAWNSGRRCRCGLGVVLWPWLCWCAYVSDSPSLYSFPSLDPPDSRGYCLPPTPCRRRHFFNEISILTLVLHQRDTLKSYIELLNIYVHISFITSLSDNSKL